MTNHLEKVGKQQLGQEEKKSSECLVILHVFALK